MYSGCPICTKSVKSDCSHTYVAPKNFYRMRIFLEDETGELETTAWEAARFITGVTAKEFEAVHVRGDHSDILNCCIGRQWIFQLTKIETNRGPYARVDHAEAVSKKELFPDPEVAGRVGEGARMLNEVLSPGRQVSAFGIGEVDSPLLTCREVEGGGSVGGRSIEHSIEAKLSRRWKRYSQRREVSRIQQQKVGMEPGVAPERESLRQNSADEGDKEGCISKLEDEILKLRTHVLSLREEIERVKFAAWRWKGSRNSAMVKLLKKRQEWEELVVKKVEEAAGRKAALKQVASMSKAIGEMKRKLLRIARSTGVPLSFPETQRRGLDLIMTSSEEIRTKKMMPVG
ncbi:hypothetical protein R1sor_000930 [Riccia sorocarpa]|uniref:Uncharacterized protein n=1 Tax=Riccia sorocarpa TaxID=122646 RepID=A0ABD3GUK2_9MARC